MDFLLLTLEISIGEYISYLIIVTQMTKNGGSSEVPSISFVEIRNKKPIVLLLQRLQNE